MQKMSRGFAKVIDQTKAGLIVSPRLEAVLHDPAFKGFTVKVEGFEGRREPDDWFHPSTHPLWEERQLFYYLTEPKKVIPEVFGREGALAVTIGSVVHDGTQHIALQHGLLKSFPNCPCPEDHNDAEVMLVDEEVGTRGHSDGVWAETGDGVELKTAHSAIVDSLNKTEFGPERLERFREKKPAYYAQAQEYLRMSGRERMLVVFISTQYPYLMAEVHVPFDRKFAYGIREKYLRVRQAVRDGRVPNGCCGGLKACPVRTLCSGYLG